jgi:predicted amidohydrolase
MKERKLELGLVQMSMTENSQDNLDKALRMIDTAAKLGARVVCLPELFNSLYFPQWERRKAVSETIPGQTTNALSGAARENSVVLVGGSIYEKDGSKLYNTTVVFDERGRILGKYRKVHLPQDSHFFEQNYFSEGKGYKVFDSRYARLGTLICFDQWYPEPARLNRLMGAEVLFYPTAIGWVKGIEPTEGDWREAWESVQRGHAVANSMVVCAVNRVGVEGDITFWGGSFVVDQFGKVLARADDKEKVLTVSCDLELGAEVESGWGFLRNRKPSTYHEIAK